MTVAPDGQVLSVSATQSRFTPVEVARLIASRRADAAHRNAQGILVSEATDPANRDAFTVPPPIADWSARALRRAQDEYEKQWGKEAMHDTLWRVQKRD